MKEYVTVMGVIALALAVIGALWMMRTYIVEAPGPQACTEEAKLCPDGSAVGRIGPNCEFAPCPSAGATTTEPTATSTTEGSAGILPYQSGVQGVISLGPTCPVMKVPPDPQCADKPYATAVVVYRAGSGTPFIIGNSDTTGVFKFSLPPGIYTLRAGEDKTLPHCAQKEVTVPTTGYATTTISCDTGIR